MPVEAGMPLRNFEVERQIACSVCHGDWKRCRLVTCPYLGSVREWFTRQPGLASTNLFGASPPSAFVGSWGYPRVLAGPLVPPAREGTAIMDASETWLGHDIGEILRFRLSLVRGKAQRPVEAARDPDRILAATQEEAMASRPVDMEMWLEKKPVLEGPFTARASPTGPSGVIRKLELAENPSVPRKVDAVVSDTDLLATEGVVDLYRGGISQSHITRVFSVGLLGTKKRRKLVPTEWSITAVDDILGKRVLERVKGFPTIDEFRVFGHAALGNNVQVLLTPTSWMFEGLEVWDVDKDTRPIADHEFYRGRKTYPDAIAGAYHATRLPVLEYLERVRRQAGAIVFMEVYKDWIPLGVWRYREIARAALSRSPPTFATLEEALAFLGARLKLRMARWRESSTLLRFLARQRRLTDFVSGVGTQGYKGLRE